MRDIYLNPTIAKLAAHLGAADAVTEATAPVKELPFRIPSNLEYYGCGALQAPVLYGFGRARALGHQPCGSIWTYAAVDNPGELYLRSLALTVGFFVALTALPSPPSGC